MTKIAPAALAAEGNPWLSAGVLALAVGAEMLRSNGMLGFLPTGRPHANKPFATFDEFYPHYLREHSDIWTKRLHYLGTALMIVLILFSRRLILPIVAGAAVGFVVFPFFRHIGTGLPEMALMVGTYVLTGYVATKSWRQVLLPLVIAYGCAWVGHFAFEGNKPATFIYPSFSLFGDFRMFYDMLTGKQPR